MADTTRDPADEQQIADPPYDAVEKGDAGPAIDAVGIGQENPDAPELDDVDPDTED